MEKLLIANRGEIAQRIQRACHKLAIKTVTIASEADREASFAKAAEELVVIGPPPVQQSYLNGAAIIAAAKKTGCDAIHPGYGFLSENSDFAAAVEAAGIVFVGPRPETIAVLGSKTGARALAAKVGVPLAAGSSGELSNSELALVAEQIGYPLMIKAVAGGGGRGMRIVRSADEMAELLPLARAEARKFFSDQRVFVEKYIERPRHIEVQIFGDRFGNVIDFGTRECSIQRRHQKLIEEAPAPIPAALTRRICAAALRIAKQARYQNAGTAEFLVSGESFYFLEINTRIQVEHPVTEEICGVDLVDLQLRVARGERLARAIKKARIRERGYPKGHAIEYRIYAEDPAADFAPAIGRIQSILRPTSSSLREESATQAGDQITPYYDAMLSKLIVSGASRAEALARSEQVLANYRVEGVATTIPFHRWVLLQAPFRRSEADISYVDRTFSATALLDVKAFDQHDPDWRAGGCVEKHSYCTKDGVEYAIEVKHLEDHTFYAAPVDSRGRRARPDHCRRSNGRDAALRAVATEVLEALPRRKIFS